MLTYDIGEGERRLVENSRLFNDGQYHFVTFVRNGKDATLRVDDYDVRTFESGKQALFLEIVVNIFSSKKTACSKY